MLFSDSYKRSQGNLDDCLMYPAQARFANIRIFVKKAITQIKWFRILSNELSLLEWPLVDDMGIACSALVNILPSLQVK